MVGLIILFVLFILSFYWIKRIASGHTRLSHIPGPKGVPLFGNVFQLDPKTFHIWITDEMKKYGRIAKLSLFTTDVVIVSGKEEIKQVLVTNGKQFSGRPGTFRSTTAYPKSLGFQDLTDEYRQHKKLIMHYMKAYGPGLGEVENLVMTITTQLLTYLKSCQGKPISITSIIRKTLIDMIYLLQFHKYAPSDEMSLLIKQSELNTRVFQIGGQGTLLDLFPFIRYFKVQIWQDFQEFNALEESLYKKWKQDYQEAKDKYQGTLIDTLFQRNKNNPTDVWDDEAVQRIISLIFLAGTSTSTVTLSSLINQLAHNKGLQDALYKENKEVLGARQVTLSDRTNMPCHEASLYETARYYSILPFLVPHKAVTDTNIGGYKITNGTEVWINMYAYSHDESVWGDPYSFRPNRFCDAAGRLVKDASDGRGFFFGAGPRVCPGEVFAKTRLFLMLATIIQNFEILPATTLAEQSSCDVRDAILDFFLHPGDVKVRMKPRE